MFIKLHFFATYVKVTDLRKYDTTCTGSNGTPSHLHLQYEQNPPVLYRLLPTLHLNIDFTHTRVKIMSTLFFSYEV